MISFSCIRNLLFLLSCLGSVTIGIAAAQEIRDCTATGVVLANPQGLIEEATGDVTAKIGDGPACPLSKDQTIVNDILSRSPEK